MTNQEIADNALAADQERRKAIARSDYPAARDARLMRDLWCALMDPKP